MSMRLFALLGFSAALCALGWAQTPPTEVELASYVGLHAAAARGDLKDIRGVTGASQVDLNARDDNGRTPLHVAAFRGQFEAAAALIAAGADPNLLDNQRYDAVTIAAVRDDLATLKALLSSGASAKLITSPYDGTALIAAAHLGHEGVVGELIKHGAPLDHVNNLGWTALIEAVVLGDGGPRHVGTVRVLMSGGADPGIADRQGVTPLEHARHRGFREIETLLVAAQAR
jgi:uncharacterized protein